MKTISKIIIFVFTFVALAASTFAQEASPREQLQQMVKQLQQSPNDNTLREQIIKLAQKLNPAPAVPEEARRYLARGIAAFGMAKNEDDLMLALPEFQNAANAAPWWAGTYFNMAKVQEKIEDFKGAITSYHFYLAAAPNASDAESIRTQSYKLEYMYEAKGKNQSDGLPTVTDSRTGLMWQKRDDDLKSNFDDAISYCNGLTLADYSDWRLPSLEELETIIKNRDYNIKNNPTIDSSLFPGTNLSYYWSSTTDDSFAAWNVGFHDGYAGYRNKSDSYYVRCVRE